MIQDIIDKIVVREYSDLNEWTIEFDSFNSGDALVVSEAFAKELLSLQTRNKK